MKNGDNTRRAAYTEEAVIDDLMRLFGWTREITLTALEDRLETFELAAAQLFVICENYSPRALRIRAALLDERINYIL